jgi:hypothetical protein
MSSIKDLPPGVQAAIVQLVHMSEQSLDRGSYCSEEWPEAYDALRIVETQLGWDGDFVWDGDND